MSARPVVLATLVDAWRHDRCTPEHTPFLAGIARASGSLMEPFGFNTGPAMFAGIYPEVSNQVHKFWYEPEFSPFGFTRFIPEWMTRLPRGGGRLDTWIFRRAEADLRARGVTTAKHLVDFRGVPHRLRRFFNLVETRNHHEPDGLPVPTVFDLMRQAGRPFLWIGVPDHTLTVPSNLADFARGFAGQDLVFVHWSETDWLGQAFGPDGSEYTDKLREIDRALEQVVGTLRATGRAVRVLAYGDHGMAPVTARVDLARTLAGLEARCPRHYVYFLDSTAARFWFFTEEARAEITGVLSRRPEGRFIDAEDRARYRLPLTDRRHWDACWMLEEGHVIHPDFFHTDLGKPMRGMHGYRPEVTANQAAWIVGGDVRAIATAGEPRQMVDVATSLCRLLALDVPQTFQGAGLCEVEA